MVKIICLLLVLGFFLALPSSGSCTPEVITRESPLLRQKLKTALLEKGPDYKPRTRHLLADGQPKYTNRLILEGSPYLLQHAHNPVNWYAWGDAAFAAAKRLGLPILLSIGYSTCHWCHVMEEETFEDEEIARYLNEHYIAIKVDREERPDLDAIYMAAVQTITGRGGWPMTVWLLPDRQPFYGGTYFPARDGDRGRAQGFLSIIKKISTLYQSRPDEIQEAGTRLTKALRQQLKPASGGHLPGTKMISEVMVDYQARFDPVYGGTLGQPKFPSSMPVRLLLRYYRRTGDEKILSMARLSLDKMAAGGIYDQVGGGFHRYATDKKWLVPHFEKMLYDNAQLIRLYALMHMTSNNPHYKEVVLSVSGWMADKMLSDHNLFYSAIDADTDQEEGGTYVWSDDEIEKLLDPDEYLMLRQHFGLDQANNFENSFHLQIKRKLADVATEHKLSLEAATLLKQTALNKLLQAREMRTQPAIDKKLLTGINALTISGLSACAIALNDEELKSTALECMNSLLLLNYRDGVLYTQPNHASNEVEGFLDDYAFTINAIMHTLELRWNSKYLTVALHLASRMIDQFYDSQNGGFYFS
ncbi:MAG: thioredoxin domain-containing protein, partial [Deltaproteobacteria bacterium]|nr:thioredoxin domain-containing protein [Deltaproteobacteria bacterium]